MSGADPQPAIVHEFWSDSDPAGRSERRNRPELTRSNTGRQAHKRIASRNCHSLVLESLPAIGMPDRHCSSRAGWGRWKITLRQLVLRAAHNRPAHANSVLS